MKRTSQIHSDLQALRKINKMVSIELMGGLGNWMFQIAFAEYLKQIMDSSVRIFIGAYSPHASTDLMAGLFKNWRNDLTGYHSPRWFTEENMSLYDWKDIITKTPEIHIIGYYQNYNYITPSFLHKLNLPTEIIRSYPDMHNTVFLHIRGGDYVNHWKHDVGLHKNYYSTAIKEFPEGTKFSVFTNDLNYAKSMEFLNHISYEFITESEIDSLYLMSQCKGGICANSSFSWWGAYLNPTRKLILPSKWFNTSEDFTDGYYFKEGTIIQV